MPAAAPISRMIALLSIGQRVTQGLERWGAPVVSLATRLVVAPIFLFSGLQKLSDWPATLYLFAHEYQVPLLSPDLAAVAAATAELSMSMLLIAGFATRLAALPLLAITCVIQFVVAAANPEYANPQHYLWMVLLLNLVVRGAGPLSIDHLILRTLAAGPRTPRPSPHTASGAAS